MNLSKACKIVRVKNAVAAGFGDTQTGSSVDMKGFCAVCFVALLGTVTATGTAKLKAQQSSDDGVADSFADLLGTGVDGGDTHSNKLLVLEIQNPRERYVKPAIVRATANVVIDGVVAFLFKADKEPVTEDASVAASELHHAPAEGTA
jgi:hypothetical protein